MSGIHWHRAEVDPDASWLVATNGHYLLRALAPFPGPSEGRTIAAAYLGSREGCHGPMLPWVKEPLCALALAKAQRIPEQCFPDYTMILPDWKPLSHAMTEIDPKALKAFLRAHGTKKGSFDAYRITVGGDDAPETFDIAPWFMADIAWPEGSVVFDVAYLIKILGFFDQKKPVEMRVKTGRRGAFEPLAPFEFRQGESQTGEPLRQAILMPRRE